MAPLSDYDSPELTRNTRMNPFEWEPRTPERSFRLNFGVRERVLDRVGHLSAPSLTVSPQELRHSAPPLSQNPLLRAAFQKMRRGDTLQILRAEKEAQNAKEDTAAARMHGSSVNQHEKRPSNPTVSLDRQAPQRRSSGIARSA